MRFVQRKHLPMGGAMITEARNRVALQIWLSTDVRLESIKTVQLVCIRNLVRDVQRVLIDLNRPRCKRSEVCLRSVISNRH